MPKYNADTSIRRAHILRREVADLSKEIETIALHMQASNYNKGFDAGFDYAASGKATSTTDPDTGQTLRTLEPIEPVEHILTTDRNGEPVCGCGYNPADDGALNRQDAISMVRDHHRESRAAA